MDNYRNNYNEFNNSLENELYRIIEDLLFQNRRTGQSSTVPNQTPPGYYNRIHDYTMFIQSLRDIVLSYNTNIQDYQNNVSLVLSIIQGMVRNISNENIYNSPNVEIPPLRQRTSRSPNIQRNRPITQNNNSATTTRATTASSTSTNREHLLSYTLYRPTIRYQDANNIRSFFQNISIRPSLQQIENATRTFTYNTSNENFNNQCPITLEHFQDGDIVRQIHHCRHIFHEHAIQSWFQSNVKCPVCRYDIRDYREPSVVNNPDISNNSVTINNTDISDNNIEDNIEDNTEENNENNIEDNNENNNEEQDEYQIEYQNLLENLTNNFANDIQSLFDNNLIRDTSQNYLFEFEINRI
jgi:hypothetical protein